MFRLTLPKGRYRLLTDSELLRESLSSYFGLPLAVMPIPHTSESLPPAFSRSRDEIVCWWPGRPAVDKGLLFIRKLASTVEPGYRDFRLVAACSSGLRSSAACVRVELLPDVLDRVDYLRWMATADVILLPYQRESYRERTSGIFVEAIVAGKIPLVTDGTWMSFQLRRHGLSELIFDWNGTRVLERIRQLLRNADLPGKISKLQDLFKHYHTVANYARSLNTLID